MSCGGGNDGKTSSGISNSTQGKNSAPSATVTNSVNAARGLRRLLRVCCLLLSISVACLLCFMVGYSSIDVMDREQ